MPNYDAIVVGSGPNGLAAAITMARAGWSVLLREGATTIGGGTRSAELTLPGFKHDICSAIHPLGVGSPFFRDLPLHEHGLQWIYSSSQLAHPFDDGTAALLKVSLEETGQTLGRDAGAYRRLMEPFVKRWEDLADEILGPLRIPPHHPFLLARFGIPALMPAKLLSDLIFRERNAKALLGGLTAHSFLPMESIISASFGIVLGLLGHRIGWPIPKGGSQSIADALASYFRSLGGEIVTDAPVTSLDELPSARAILFDVTPKQLLKITGDKLNGSYRRRLEGYRYGPGLFKVDWALSGPVPWRAEECKDAGTVHVAGTMDEIALSERAIWQGRVSDHPFVIFAQQSLFDESRAPAGKHTGWGYCHVPHGSTEDYTDRIERQIERFAPGFRDLILERHTYNTAQLELHNPNYIGGDINGGIQDWRQLFTRPMLRRNPYATPLKGVYLCSSSTPPGGGVHGMCGFFAAKSALRENGIKKLK